MKKDILFIVSDMKSGGFQKSLTSLLQCFDYKKYSVDLLILSPKGIFINQIPKEVNIIKSEISPNFFMEFPRASIELIKEKKLILSIKRGFHFIISRLDKGRAGIYMSQQMLPLNKEYDAAIDYNGQHILYYMVDKIKAKKKISYFHSDYKRWPYYKSADSMYYPKVDYIVTISDICKESLDEIFSSCKDKTRVIQNISSPRIIRNLSKEESPIRYNKNFTNIVMVGRPYEVKGTDLAIEACSMLKKEGYKISFYVVGTSNEVDKYKELAKKFNVEKEFIFVGETDNPYTFVEQADIYVHPSRFEGKSVAIDEAKILCKPIIISNFTTAKDHINHEVNGLIVDMSPEGVYNGIKRLIEEKDLRDRLVYNLKSENLGNEDEVNKLYQLID